MAETSGKTSGKVCVHCGVNCEGRPRVKDADGRYACKACFDRIAAGDQSNAAATAPVVKVVANARAPAAVGSNRPATSPSVAQVDDDAMDLSALVSAEKQASENVHYAEMQRCPHCNAVAPAGSRICTGCGFDTQTGAVAAKIKVFKQPSEKIPSRLRSKASGPQRLAGEGNIGKWASVVCGVLAIVLLFLMQGNREACYAMIFIGAVYGLCWSLVSIVGPFSEDDTFWGVINLMTHVIGVTAPMTLFYVLCRSSSPFLRWGLITQILMFFGVYSAYSKLWGFEG
jgi:hypothetical protein